MKHIKIVQRPIGEAPDWVRDAWVGLVLPLVVERKRTWPSVGVLTGPVRLLPSIIELLAGRTIKIEAYVVNANAAVDVLAATRPKAAQWWRDNTAELLRLNRSFLFDAEACEPVE